MCDVRCECEGVRCEIVCVVRCECESVSKNMQCTSKNHMHSSCTVPDYFNRLPLNYV